MGESSRSVGKVGMRFAVMVGLAALVGLVALVVAMSERGAAAYPGLNGRIAYAFGDAYQTSIWTANPDGSAPVKLTSGSGDYAPAYSANGSRIAFERESSIFTMNADGSGLTLLAPGSSSNASDTKWQENYEDPESKKVIPFVKIQTFTSTWHYFGSPSFSPDGTQLAVGEGNGKRVETNICAVEALEDKECLGFYEPESFFDYNQECIGCTSHIITINSITGALTAQVTPASSLTEDYGPSYAANGMLAFSRYTSSSSGPGPGSSAILLVSSPGAAPVQVTAGPNDYSPSFSPDSSRIVFSHGSRELGIISAGGGPVSLISVPNPPGATFSFMESPSFSPDGSKLVFHREVFGSKGRIEGGLYVANADGSAAVKIVDGGVSPNWQSVAPPPPPPLVAAKLVPKKGKAKLNKKNEAVIGTIVCGGSPCTLKVLSAKLKAGKSKYSVTTKLTKKLAPGKKTKVTVTVAGKALKALKKAHKGSLSVKISLTDAAGKTVLKLNSTLIPPKAKKKPHTNKKAHKAKH
jgi:WD40-like Beta Propeller Repeat